MDSGSILMIYQHFPKGNHEDFIRTTAGELESGPTYILPLLPMQKLSFLSLQKTKNSQSTLMMSLNATQIPIRLSSA